METGEEMINREEIHKLLDKMLDENEPIGRLTRATLLDDLEGVRYDTVILTLRTGSETRLSK